DGANATTNAEFQSVDAAGFATELANEIVVIPLTHRGVQIDDVQPFVSLEFVEQAENILDGEFAASAVNELHGLTALQINAGNQHGRRTSMPRAARNCFSSRIGWMLSWKIDAASAASAAPSMKISAKCSGSFAPPEAITGTLTAREIVEVSGTSK